jgi:hydrogenase expression/formation protein HypD
MKYVDEFRDPVKAQLLLESLKNIVTREHVIMEICGGQTHSIVRFGIDELIPQKIRLIHGPGCPVCVTPVEKIDKAIEIALMPDVIFCSFGDMLRVPGSDMDLLKARAKGADVRVVYSPADAVSIAEKDPSKEVVFFAVGFETTAPPNAFAVALAERNGIKNFSMIVSHVLVPPAIRAILGSGQNKVQGFLAAGHVCTVMGYYEYESIAAEYKVPIVVTGFEPLDILQGIFMCVKQLEEGRHEVENQYTRVVTREGNVSAVSLVNEVFETGNRKWRGIGEIRDSGLHLKEKYRKYDAEERFGISDHIVEESSDCRSGLILQGLMKPPDCPAFGTKCTPEHPLGATMVSSEGACSAYYLYKEKNISADG